jgi:hypothetical protein
VVVIIKVNATVLLSPGSTVGYIIKQLSNSSCGVLHVTSTEANKLLAASFGRERTPQGVAFKHHCCQCCMELSLALIWMECQIEQSVRYAQIVSVAQRTPTQNGAAICREVYRSPGCPPRSESSLGVFGGLRDDKANESKSKSKSIQFIMLQPA